MSSLRPLRLVAAGLVLATASLAVARETKLPFIDGKEAVASVNGEPISLADLLSQVAAFHRDMTETQASVSRPDPSALLNRMIDVRLILQEARNIGLHELPEVREQVDLLREGIIKKSLVDQQVSEKAAPDPNVVENIYREAVKEWQIDSVLFESEDMAVAFAGLVNKGSEFEALAAEAVEAGKARGGQRQWMKAKEMRPEVASELAPMKPGTISAPVRLSDGYAIVKVLGVRYPDNPEERRKAETAAVEVAKQAKLREYIDKLRDEYATIDSKLFESLDYESPESGLEKLRSDERVVATIKGGEPISVADLTEGVEKKFYHGMESAIERKKINTALPGILKRLMLQRATMLESKQLGIEETEPFKEAVRVQVEGILFSRFVTKVISPDVNLTEAEIKKEYDDHIQEYTSPPMMRLEGLAFSQRADAEAALEKLHKGADFKWVKANEPGQANPDDFANYLDFRGSLVVTSLLPNGVQKVVEGAAAGEYRFYSQDKGPSYVLYVRDVVAPRQRPYETTREEIAQRIVSEKRQAALEDFTAKLRAASEIEVFATRSELDALLGLRFAEGS